MSENVNDFMSYMADLCTRHVDVRHSSDQRHFAYAEEHLITGVNSEIFYPCVLITKDAFGFGGSPDNYIKGQNYGIFVLEHVSDINDFAEQIKAQEKCQVILEELINRILADKGSKRFLARFNLTSVQGEPVSNLHNTAFGVAAMFNLDSSYSGLNCRKAFLSDEELKK